MLKNNDIYLIFYSPNAADIGDFDIISIVDNCSFICSYLLYNIYMMIPFDL